MLSGAKMCRSCRSRRELSNEYLLSTCKLWRRYSREQASQSLPKNSQQLLVEYKLEKNVGEELAEEDLPVWQQWSASSLLLHLVVKYHPMTRLFYPSEQMEASFLGILVGMTLCGSQFLSALFFETQGIAPPECDYDGDEYLFVTKK